MIQIPPPKDDWIISKAEIKNSPIQGKGLFAITSIQCGEKVVIWGGNFVSKEKAKQAKKEGKFVMQFDDDVYSVETTGENDTYFINHSCDSNLWMDDAFTLSARKDIAPGEEITADYCLWTIDEGYVSKWDCICRSEFCREKVTGLDYKNPDIQKRYQGHFAPLVSRKVPLSA